MEQQLEMAAPFNQQDLPCGAGGAEQKRSQASAWQGED